MEGGRWKVEGGRWKEGCEVEGRRLAHMQDSEVGPLSISIMQFLDELRPCDFVSRVFCEP